MLGIVTEAKDNNQSVYNYYSGCMEDIHGLYTEGLTTLH